MIDVWLLFTLLQPFIVVLIHTYMVTLREENEECEVSGLGGENAKKLNSVRRFAIFTNPDLCYSLLEFCLLLVMDTVSCEFSVNANLLRILAFLAIRHVEKVKGMLELAPQRLEYQKLRK